MTVDVLDFAGQIEYYVTHQLFLSDVYCMYVVVSSLYQRQPDGSMKMDPYDCSGRIRFWLSFLSSLFDPNTQVPVSVVLSHADCNKSPQSIKSSWYLNQSQAKSFIPPLDNVDGFVLDYSNPDHVQSILQSISSCMTNVWQRIAIPSSYDSAEQAVLHEYNRLDESEKLPIIKMEDLTRIIEACHSHFSDNTNETNNESSDDGLMGRVLSYLKGNGVIYTHSVIHHTRSPTAINNNNQNSSSNISESDIEIKHDSIISEKKSSDEVCILNPLRWFSSVLALFVGDNFGDEGTGALISHNPLTGIVRWDEIKRHQQSLRCCTDDDLHMLMSALQHIELCLSMGF